MNRSTIWRITVAMLAILGTSSAMAQRTVSGPAPIGAEPTKPATRTEDFDRDPVDGWRYSCPHEFLPAGGGRVLQTSGGGHAVWTAAGRLTDFRLSFDYAYEEGSGDVFFRATETPAGMEFYCVTLEPTTVTLARRLHAPGRESSDLASAPCVLQPYTWYDVTVRATGGWIEVSIGGEQVLRCQDPQPLAAGECGLGVIAGSGAVLYDNVSLSTAQ